MHHGLVAGINAVKKYNYLQKIGIEENNTSVQQKIIFPQNTMIGALSNYIQVPNEKFQPMNANFGIIPELGEHIKDKKVKYGKLADRAIEELKIFMQKNNIK